MTRAFFRFPHTPHLCWAGVGAPPRDDKVLSEVEVEALLSGPVVIEEKMDGANLGFSASEGRVQPQNRGDYLRSPYGGQFSRLTEWLSWREQTLVDALGEDLIAFGEWCAARHSIEYDCLPDWWLLFDLYDRRIGRFWSTTRRNQFAAEMRLRVVPEIYRGKISIRELPALLDVATSRYGRMRMEGVVIRREDPQWLLGRAKLVRLDFSQSIDEHWRSRPLHWNRVRSVE